MVYASLGICLPGWYICLPTYPPWYTHPVLPVYTTLYTLVYPPCTLWVHPPCLPASSCGLLHTRVRRRARDGALGSGPRKALGEESFLRSGARKCLSSYASARRNTRGFQPRLDERLDRHRVTIEPGPRVRNVAQSGPPARARHARAYARMTVTRVPDLTREESDDAHQGRPEPALPALSAASSLNVKRRLRTLECTTRE